MEKRVLPFLLFFGLIVLTRLPFLFDGYGSEEDACELRIVAERMTQTGQYEVSRLPGHPFQEIIYTTCWRGGAIAFNSLTLLISTLGIAAFAAMLKNFGFRRYFLIAATLAFTPIVYINSSNAMDYTWTMAFVLIAGYYISNKQLIAAGIMVGIAIGCRITAGAMLLPYTMLIWSMLPENERISSLLRFYLSAILVAVVCFIPVYLTYGIEFFTFYEHFPIPGFAKNFYKGTIGAFGLPGCIGILAAGVIIVRSGKILQSALFETRNISPALIYCSTTAIILYIIAFARVPLKSAFIIPIVPWLLILLAMLLQEKAFRNVAILFMIGSFFFGVNLAEAKRGSAVSRFSYTTTISGQPIAIDPLNGLMLADQSKRQQRRAFIDKVIVARTRIQEKTVLITGWWQADLLVYGQDQTNEKVVVRHYIDEPELAWYHRNGYRIFYLEDQGQYNDLRFNKEFTDKYASAFPF